VGRHRLTERTVGVRVGIAHHLGWAIAVTAAADHRVVDRRRIELVEPGVATAPVHHEGKQLDDAAAAALVRAVRASSLRTAAAELGRLAADVGQPIASLSLRAWPADFPTDITVLRRVPYEARADSVMYREVLAELARERGWAVHTFDASTVEPDAEAQLGARAHDVLHGPRERLGPPWSKDHRIALAATVLAAGRG
jgi:hypothetical protein